MRTTNTLRRSLLLTAAIAASFAGQAANADVFITEWMYKGDDATGEYIEFTNTGNAAVDFSGWSFSDSGRSVGSVDLSLFGVVGAGESVILTEASAAAFRSVWNLDSSVGVIGGNTKNLGRDDEINLYDSFGALIDRLTYGDGDFGGSIRTEGASGNPDSLSILGVPSDPYGWSLAAIGDVHGSYLSQNGDIGNPGNFALAPAPVPLPAAAWLLFSGLAGLAGVSRRKAAKA